MLLFFDTETTGKANFDLPADHPSQPRLVQIAFQLYTNQGTNPLHSLCCIVKPDGFTIPDEATDIHGITTSLALGIGVKPTWILNAFTQLWEKSTVVIAHNIDFDLMVILNEWSRLGIVRPKEPTTFCTMTASTNVLKLPGKYNNYKWPKLSEAYAYFTGKQLENEHDALVDINATKTVYDGLTKLGLTPTKLKT